MDLSCPHSALSSIWRMQGRERATPFLRLALAR
jgi:hypothetical protein